MHKLAAFANRLADASRAEIARLGDRAFSPDNKASGAAEYDPVTEADRGAERVMRALIEEHFPDHGIMGEEFPDRPASSPYSWSLDPIDGTRSFMCGLPTWVTLIALLEDGAPVLGLIDVPRLEERYIGSGDEAALAEQGPVRTSGCTAIGEARLATTDPFLFDGAGAAGFAQLRRSARVTRYGHDGYAYARLAAGTLDLVVESGLKPHDYNALIPLVRAAGGTIGDWQGGEDFTAGKVVAAASRPLYDAAVAALSQA